MIAVNQFGEKNVIGQIDPGELFNTEAVFLDDERALLFLDSDNNLRLYLLTSDAMQEISLPTDPFYYNTEALGGTRKVVAFYEDYAAFTYGSLTGDIDPNEFTPVHPEAGPVLHVDLNSLTATVIDAEANRGFVDNEFYWFQVSADSRYLRYLNGYETRAREIRELDMATGEARTLYSAEGSAYRMFTTRQGDLWYLQPDRLIIDLNSNSITFDDETLTARPVGGGKALVFPADGCPDGCELKVITPFGNEAELSFAFPWGFEFNYAEANQFLPDQSLLFVGEAYHYLASPPAALETYPDLQEDDMPLFRLTPDGEARLVGLYTGTLSEDGRFFLLRAYDQTTYFIYDAIEDRPLFDIPIDPDLEDYYVTVRFYDTGIFVNSSATVPGDPMDLRFFYYTYVYESAELFAQADPLGLVHSCPTLFADGLMACWIYRTDNPNFDLAIYDPATGSKTILTENTWLIDVTELQH